MPWDPVEEWTENHEQTGKKSTKGGLSQILAPLSMSRNAGRESSPLPSLHGRRLKGKGKGILGVRETRRTLEEGGNPNLTLPLTLYLPPSLPPSLLPRAPLFSRAQNSLSPLFQRLPRRLPSPGVACPRERGQNWTMEALAKQPKMAIPKGDDSGNESRLWGNGYKL